MLKDTTVGLPVYYGDVVCRITDYVKGCAKVVSGDKQLASMVVLFTPQGILLRSGIFFLKHIDGPGLERLKKQEEEFGTGKKKLYDGRLEEVDYKVIDKTLTKNGYQTV